MTERQKQIGLMVRLAPETIPELQEFLAERDPNFSLPSSIIVIAQDAPDSAVLLGWQAQEKTTQINRFLRDRGVGTQLPEDIPQRGPETIHELLELAIGHFSWDRRNRPDGAWWLDDGVPWTDILKDHPALLPGKPDSPAH